MRCWQRRCFYWKCQTESALASFLRKPKASLGCFHEQTQLSHDLDAESYEKREAARRDLIRVGERAEIALRRALGSGQK